jgi:peptidoglycan/xylan/chitin deacetylase (PgdA/CDA1 family)
VIFAATALLAVPTMRAGAAQRNRPITSFTFAERGDEIGTLYRMGLEQNPDHIPYFCSKLKSTDPDVREAAVAQLLFTHDERAVEPLSALMNDPSSKIRRGAIACLRRIGSKGAIPALKEALTFEPPEPEFDPHVFGMGSMEGIARRGQGFFRQYKGSTKSELPEREYWNRLAAAIALHTLGDDSGKATVLQCLREGHAGGMALDAVYLMNITEVVDLLMEDLEKGRINTGFLKAIRDLDYGGELPSSVVDRIIEMDKTTHIVARYQTSSFLARYGDERIIPLFREYLEKNRGQYKAHNLHAVVEGLKRFKTEESAEVLVDYLIVPREIGARPGTAAQEPFAFRQPVAGQLSQVRPVPPPRVFELACDALAEMPTDSQVDTLRKTYAVYKSPVDFFMNRLYVAYVLAKGGHGDGRGELVEALGHTDAAVRRLGFKLLTKLNDGKSNVALIDAVKRETDARTFRAMKRYLTTIGLMNHEVKRLPAPQDPLPADTYGRPRYIHFNYDDCATTYAMERFADFVEEMAAEDARWVFNVTIAPLSKYDHEYNTYLVQRLFDRGCEVSNHTLHHNHPPAESHLMASDDQTLRAEIGGCTNWLKTYIKSLDKVYHWHPGGGGYYKPGQKLRKVTEIAEIAREAGLTRDIQYEVLKGTQKTEYVDPYAPSYHEQFNPARLGKGQAPPLFPYRDQKDLDFGYAADEAWERIDAFAASFHHWYFNAPDKVLFFMGHDWTNGPIPNRLGHEEHWDILKGFIKDVLLTNRDRYPLAYCVTHLELAHVFNEGADPDNLLNLTSHLQTRSRE